MERHKVRITRYFFLFLIIALLSGSIAPSALAQDLVPMEQNLVLANGVEVKIYSINSSATPPQGKSDLIPTEQLPNTVLPDFPAYKWVLGSTAVSAAMIAAYQDRTDWPKIYTGPTNGGVMPLSEDSSWGTWKDESETEYPNNPLVASREGLDGRSVKGTIEDYWIVMDSEDPDPFITDNWEEHDFGTAIGDYMRTSQSSFNNFDGHSKIFLPSSGFNRLDCADMIGENGNDLPDANLGRMRFYEARGYEVNTCFNQKKFSIVHQEGFDFNDFKAEIDAGFPVMIHLVDGDLRHTVVGYGYKGLKTIYIRDTWNNEPENETTMDWNETYKGMKIESVSVLQLTIPPKKQYLPLVLKPVPLPPVDYTIKNWNFEEGRQGWTEVSTHNYELILKRGQFPGDVNPYEGDWAVWLGGAYDETASISQIVNVPPEEEKLIIKYWIGSAETECNNDQFRFYVGGYLQTSRGLCKTTGTGGWRTMVLSIHERFRGKKVELKFEIKTNDTLNSNFFIDNVEWGSATNQNGEDLHIPAIPLDSSPESTLPRGY